MVDFDKFLKWVKSHFDEVNVKGKEIRVHSIFTNDDNFHLWCNPSGGKKKRKNGVFHCFKTDKKGTLVSLVMKVDKCNYSDAIATLRGETPLRELEKQLEEFFHQQDILMGTTPLIESKPPNPIVLPENSYIISSLPKNNWWRKKANEYLITRHIPEGDLYICTKGMYKARIVIPYYDKNGKLIYWNARHISPKAKLRYIGPPKECGTGKEDVIYMVKWPEPGQTIHICEGEFNAKSLTIAGFNGGACGGKNMSEKQAEILKDYKVVLCLDRDKSGFQGSANMTNKLNSITMRLKITKPFDRVQFVRPPEGINDWNQMLVKFGPNILAAYIEKYTKPIEAHAPFGAGGQFFAL